MVRLSLSGALVSWMHNLANRVKVTKIEPLDDDSGNYAFYVDKKVKTYLMKGYEVTQRMAQRAVSYYGWFKNSNLHQFMEKYGIEELQKYCKRRLSYLSKRNRAKEALTC